VAERSAAPPVARQTDVGPVVLSVAEPIPEAPVADAPDPVRRLYTLGVAVAQSELPDALPAERPDEARRALAPGLMQELLVVPRPV
jgi:hypothetical protein